MTEMTSKGLAVTYFNKWILCIIECLKSLFKIKLTALTLSLVHSAIMRVTLLRNLACSKRKKERKKEKVNGKNRSFRFITLLSKEFQQ